MKMWASPSLSVELPRRTLAARRKDTPLWPVCSAWGSRAIAGVERIENRQQPQPRRLLRVKGSRHWWLITITNHTATTTTTTTTAIDSFAINTTTTTMTTRLAWNRPNDKAKAMGGRRETPERMFCILECLIIVSIALNLNTKWLLIDLYFKTKSTDRP